MAVNKERVKLLVDALRSGKYAQAREQLRVGDSYCCLGVACDVSGIGEWDGNAYVTKVGVGAIKSGEKLVMPTPVRQWYGLPDNSPELLDDNDEMTEAVVLNDENGANFAQIADAFERTFLKEDDNG